MYFLICRAYFLHLLIFLIYKIVLFLALASEGGFIVAILPSNRRFKSPISVPVTLDKREGILITRLASRTRVPQNSGIWLPFWPDTRL